MCALSEADLDKHTHLPLGSGTADCPSSLSDSRMPGLALYHSTNISGKMKSDLLLICQIILYCI